MSSGVATRPFGAAGPGQQVDVDALRDLEAAGRRCPPTRADAVDPDPGLGQFDGERAGEHDHAALRRAVGGVVGGGPEAGQRGHVDDRPRRSSSWSRAAWHMRKVPVRLTRRVCSHWSRPRSAVREKAPTPARFTRGPAARRRRLPPGRRPAGRGARRYSTAAPHERGRSRRGPWRGRPARPPRWPRRREVEVGAHDDGALVSQALGGRPPDAAAGAGDQCCPSVEARHGGDSTRQRAGRRRSADDEGLP